MRRVIQTVCALSFSVAMSAPFAAGQECDNGSFDSTYDLIQRVVFENKGCTATACHGPAAAGGLVLTADVSYDNLVSQPVQTVDPSSIPGLQRVVPSQKDQSLLYLNLAAATLPDQWEAPLRAMPLGVEPLSLEELEAVRMWIEAAASRDGVVPGTADLLDACLPPAEPIAVEPLEPPQPGEGVQIRAPKWILPAQSENEVCFASYYDVTDQVPEEFRGPDGTTFRYKSQQIRQDPLSHHLIVDTYHGMASPDDRRWGTFRCRGGDKEGEICPVTDLTFCGEGICGSDWKRAIACIGFGPPDQGLVNESLVIIQEASAQLVFPDGAFREAPLRGMMIWNSHAFNLTDKDGKLEAWMNFEFAGAGEQKWRMERLFNASDIFAMNVPPFEAQEVCRHHVFDANTRLYELSSHTHQRGERFDVFAGRYVCLEGANAGDPCYPPSTPGDPVVDLCAGSACGAYVPPETGDCDGDGRLGVPDLITQVGMALGERDMTECPSSDPDGSGSISVAELIQLVRAALAAPSFRDAEDDLLYTNLVYNDPTVILYDPPMALPDTRASAAARTFTYCSLFDNGYSDPDRVKTLATFPDAEPAPCFNPSGCIEGRVGETCSGGGQRARDASCDSAPGTGDGVCGACTVRGGTTTEDEMYILMGAYYVED